MFICVTPVHFEVWCVFTFRFYTQLELKRVNSDLMFYSKIKWGVINHIPGSAGFPPEIFGGTESFKTNIFPMKLFN
jgi:hypothetical protein